jgi:hypothetical protein
VTVWAKNVQRILSPRDYERVARETTDMLTHSRVNMLKGEGRR